MIRKRSDLEWLLANGRTIVRLTEMGGGTNFHWATADTNEPVHSSAIKACVKRGKARVIASDLCGEPMQYGNAA